MQWPSVRRIVGRACLLVMLSSAAAQAQMSREVLSATPPESLEGWTVFATGPVMVAMKWQRDARGPYARADIRAAFFAQGREPLVARAVFNCTRRQGPMQSSYVDAFIEDGELSRYEATNTDPRVPAWAWWWNTNVLADHMCGRPLSTAAQQTLLADSLVRRHRSLGDLSQTLRSRGAGDGLMSDAERLSALACFGLVTPEDGEPSPKDALVLMIAMGPALNAPNGPMMRTAAAIQDPEALMRGLGIRSPEEIAAGAPMARVKRACRARLDSLPERYAARLRRQ